MINNAVGKTKDDAKTYLEGLGYSMRVVAEDGQAFMVTMDHRTDRVNVVVDRGVVSAIQEVG